MNLSKTRLSDLSKLAMLSMFALVTSACSPPVTFTHGVAAGDVTDTSAVLWTRTDIPAEFSLEIEAAGDVKRYAVKTMAADDFTTQVPVEGLLPDTEYEYRFVTGRLFGASQASGTFRTAPSPDAEALPLFVFVGDVGGQAYCRDAEHGYDAFSRMAALHPDALLANGDMIYADSICPAEGPDGWKNLPGDFPSVADVEWAGPELREAFDAHWRYNRSDPSVEAFLAHVPIYVQWDDHEVINDFGAGWDRWTQQPDKPGYPQLVQAGREAFFDWNPISRNPKEPERIYRSFRWGRHLEVFFLDGRSYRSPNGMPDGPDKTLLGTTQRDWLVDSVVASDATWKVISSDIPLTLSTGWPEDYGRDAFADGVLEQGVVGTPEATGAEDELVAVLRRFDTADVKNLVVLATDVHFAMNLRWSKDFDGDGDLLTVYELISGPLNAVSVPVKEPDPSFEPEVLFAKGEWFNFATLRLQRSENGTGGPVFVYDVRGAADGMVEPGSLLTLQPAQ